MLTTLLLALAFAAAPSADTEVRRVLDDWHDAAARADEARYFSHFTADAVFLGTDPDERWPLAAFRAYAHPHFAKGKAWKFRATVRDVHFSPDGKVAWFEEELATEKMGHCRGTGVLLRDGTTWRLAQYNLSVPIPNALFDGVKRVLDAGPREK